MLNFYIIAFFVGVLGVSASPTAAAGCNQDNCLRGKTKFFLPGTIVHLLIL